MHLSAHRQRRKKGGKHPRERAIKSEWISPTQRGQNFHKKEKKIKGKRKLNSSKKKKEKPQGHRKKGWGLGKKVLTWGVKDPQCQGEG